MVYLGNNVFRGKKAQEAYDKTFAGKYQKLLKKNHFLYFGLPFMLSIVAGSIYLQTFTAVKWEKYDAKHQQLSESEMLSLIDGKRKLDKRDDYYRLQGFQVDPVANKPSADTTNNDDFDYEMVRVKRKKEDEPVW